jgi:rhodanese-related sulfurtransferase
MDSSKIYLVQTDTTVGFLSSDDKKLSHIKQRPQSQKILQVVDSFKILKQNTRIPNTHKKRIRRSKRTTIIYPNGLSFRVVPNDDKHHNFIKKVKKMYSTSANSHYLGKESKAKRFGHIPTAQNYACTNNFSVTKDGNKMKEFDELQKVYKDIPKNKEVILYCNGGAEAALNFIVLTKLGYKASVYDGSWFEWGNDKNVPIENPSKK